MTRAEAPQLALPVPLVNVLPDFAAELAEALRCEDGSELADQVGGLSITAMCGCGDDFCASFYTGPRPDGPWAAQHRNVTPETATGMVILDVVDGRIRFVEVLHREDMKSVISALTEKATEARPTLRRGCAEDVGESSGRNPVEVPVFRPREIASDLRFSGGRGGT